VFDDFSRELVAAVVEAYDKREDFRGSKFIKRSDAATIRAAQQP
jgi:hypothetical protein